MSVCRPSSTAPHIVKPGALLEPLWSPSVGPSTPRGPRHVWRIHGGCRPGSPDPGFRFSAYRNSFVLYCSQPAS